VGVVIVSFGIFWLGEGLGVAWPGNDLAVLAIIVSVLALGSAPTGDGSFSGDEGLPALQKRRPGRI